MKNHRAFILLLVFTTLIVGCGSSPERQLQSVTINASANNSQIEFTAVGTFSEPPNTVSSLAVDWSNGFLAPPPPGNMGYTLTAQPYVVNCAALGSGTEVQVTALAPQDPGAPLSGSLPYSKLVAGHFAIACP